MQIAASKRKCERCGIVATVIFANMGFLCTKHAIEDIADLLRHLKRADKIDNEGLAWMAYVATSLIFEKEKAEWQNH